jgi:hypothetical protein
MRVQCEVGDQRRPQPNSQNQPTSHCAFILRTTPYSRSLPSVDIYRVGFDILIGRLWLNFRREEAPYTGCTSSIEAETWLRVRYPPDKITPGFYQCWAVINLCFHNHAFQFSILRTKTVLTFFNKKFRPNPILFYFFPPQPILSGTTWFLTHLD